MPWLSRSDHGLKFRKFRYLGPPPPGCGVSVLRKANDRTYFKAMVIGEKGCSLMQTALHGFNGTDPFQLCYPDPLHQTELGDQRRLVEGLLSHLTPSDAARLNAHLLCIHHPCLALPGGGFGAGLVPAYQQSAAFKCLPVALLGLNSPHAAAYMTVAVRKPRISINSLFWAILHDSIP
jgi:hypothetical protein